MVASRQNIKNPGKIFRLLTSPFRIKPSFIIIGVNKCGTRAFLSAVTQHPLINAPTKKEIHFFDYNYHKGILWYKSHFPLYFRRIKYGKFMTGEATASYVYHKVVHDRILHDLPQVKLIILIRNPVDRAYSQYNHNVRENIEEKSFEEAIKFELDNEIIETRKFLEKEKPENFKRLRNHPILHRGIYVEHIKQWIQLGKNQLLIIKTEEFAKNPKEILNKTFEFLNLPKYDIKQVERKNVGNYDQMKYQTKEKLSQYYEPYNKELDNLLDDDFQ